MERHTEHLCGTLVVYFAFGTEPLANCGGVPHTAIARGVNERHPVSPVTARVEAAPSPFEGPPREARQQARAHQADGNAGMDCSAPTCRS